MSRQNGMTMVELLVCLVIVLVIIGTATGAYLKLLKGYKSQGKVSQSYMANLTGMELLRYDVEMAGFGLFTAKNGSTYDKEAAGNPADLLNDIASGVPRPFAFSNNTGNNGCGAHGSDILAIKSTVAGLNSASKKWSMIIHGTPSKVKLWGGAALDPNLDFTTNDRFIILDNDGSLQPTGSDPYYTFSGSAPDAGYYSNASAIDPGNTQSIYFLYGLDVAAPRMPFNRVDYYLGPAGSSANSCASSTSTLYRATINQSDGARNPMPLIDCVRDFQVAFGLDTNANGSVDTWKDNLDGLNAATIRQKVREVRVFVLYHEGGKNPDFRFSGTLNLGDAATSGDPNFKTLSAAALPGSLSSFTPAGNDAQYRWKVIELAIKPMNLNK